MERLSEIWRGRRIEACPETVPGGRWLVAVRIIPMDGVQSTYRADDGITYILEEEAAHEALRLGRRIIERGMS